MTTMDRANYMIESLEMLKKHDYDYKKLPSFDVKSDEDIIIQSNIRNVFRERRFLSQIKDLISTEYIFEEILEKILSLISSSTNTNRIGIAYVDYEREEIVAEHGAFDYGKVLLLPGFAVSMKQTSLAEIIKTKQGQISNNLIKELEKRPNSASLKLLVKEGIKSNLIIPLITNENVYGFLFFSSLKEGNYGQNDLDLGVKIGQEVAGILNTTHLIKKMFITMTSAFANLVEKRDDETGAHLLRMTEYSKLIAEELVGYEKDEYKIRQSFVSDIGNYAAVHDIGKIGIPDSILKKPGRLTLEERKVMETHTNIGADIIRGIQKDLNIFNKDFFKVALDITESHHERWDGMGYPNGLKGQEIPLAARVVAIADVFDALTSKRVYKESMEFERSVRIINEGSGTQFDPELVNIFNKKLPEIRKFYQENKNLII